MTFPIDFSNVLALVIGGLAAALLTLLIALVIWRSIDEVLYLRRQAVIKKYQPLVDSLLTAPPAPEFFDKVSHAPERHRRIVGDLLLATLRVTAGEVVPRFREAAQTLGLLDQWAASLDDRRWWVRAEAVRALGLMRDPGSVAAILRALDESHEEVRAAAVDALGRIGDPSCGPILLGRLKEESRHQRVRLIEAIRTMGEPMVPVLLAYAQEHPEDTVIAVDTLGIVGGTAAIPSLLEWTTAEDAAVRAAALRAVGSIGIDDRSFFFALRAMDDPDLDVRAMASRALGRSGRQTAVPHLAAHLGDEWRVAAQCGSALRRLGLAGKAALEARVAMGGRGAELSRQMLWELRFMSGGA